MLEKLKSLKTIEISTPYYAKYLQDRFNFINPKKFKLPLAFIDENAMRSIPNAIRANINNIFFHKKTYDTKYYLFPPLRSYWDVLYRTIGAKYV